MYFPTLKRVSCFSVGKWLTKIQCKLLIWFFFSPETLTSFHILCKQSNCNLVDPHLVFAYCYQPKG